MDQFSNNPKLLIYVPRIIQFNSFILVYFIVFYSPLQQLRISVCSG